MSLQIAIAKRDEFRETLRKAIDAAMFLASNPYVPDNERERWRKRVFMLEKMRNEPG